MERRQHNTPLHLACYRLDDPWESKTSCLSRRGDDREAYRRNLAALLELVPEWFVTLRGRAAAPLHLAAHAGNAIAVELLLDLPSAEEAAAIVVEGEPRFRGTALELAVWEAEVEVVRQFLAKVPGIRLARTADGGTLEVLVDNLCISSPERYMDVHAAFSPAVKSATS